MSENLQETVERRYQTYLKIVMDGHAAKALLSIGKTEGVAKTLTGQNIPIFSFNFTIDEAKLNAYLITQKEKFGPV